MLCLSPCELCVVKKQPLIVVNGKNYLAALSGRFKFDNKLSWIQMDVIVRTFGLYYSAKPSVCFWVCVWGGGGRGVRDRMVGGFIIARAISACHQ